MSASGNMHYQRNLADVVAEIKDEIKSFVQTHIEMLRSEWSETRTTLSRGLPLVVIAVTLLGTAYLLFTLAAVSLVVVAFYGNPYAWFLAFLIIGGLWAIGGAMMAYFAYNVLHNHAMFPRRTVEMLKADKMWLHNQAGEQI
jgi:uncharacterized membrane protein YqjE